MRFIPVVIASAALVIPTTNSSHTTVTANSQCTELFSVMQYRNYAPKVYNRVKISLKAHYRVNRMFACQHSKWASQTVKRLHNEYLRERALSVEMRSYKKHPMASCTWYGESGVGVPEWSMRRYTIWNGGSHIVPPPGARERASGKFQFLRSTWMAIGGGRYADAAAMAPPVIQERMARRLAREGISVHWVNC